MKKCPYCGYENDDQETVCKKCCAGFPYGFPHEEAHNNAEPEGEKPVRESRKKIRS